MKMMKLRSLVLAGFLALPLVSSHAQVGISVNFAPPVLPVYQQPPCPVAGYIWTPGYWGYGYDVGDYYWVPGVWVPPPSVGLLWTPPWWGWNNGVYAFNQGYWGPTVGFYGGVNYGHGYNGNGYWGGRWEGNAFRYNTAVTRVNNTVIHNTYVDRSVVNKQVTTSSTSFNGPNGVKAQPTAEQKAAAQNARKMPPTSQQLARQQAAAKDRNLQASVNKGHPKPDAIRSFNKSEGAEHGKGAQGAGATAGTEKAGNKPGNATADHRQGPGAAEGHGKGTQGAGAARTGNKPGAAGAGQAENKRGNMAEHNRQGAGAGNLEGHGKKVGAENHGNMRNVGGNQAKAHARQTAGAGSPPRGPNQMTQRSGQPKTAARNAQMGGKHPQMGGGGNRPRPAPKAQPQGKKKKPGER
jgi:hypothetical protein